MTMLTPSRGCYSTAARASLFDEAYASRTTEPIGAVLVQFCVLYERKSAISRKPGWIEPCRV